MTMMPQHSVEMKPNPPRVRAYASPPKLRYGTSNAIGVKMARPDDKNQRHDEKELTMPAQEGKKAPPFNLETSTGKKIALKDFKDKKWVVLYFYPKDMTSGCTAESCDFRDRNAERRKLGAATLGVSPDGLKSHAKFIEKHGLNFPLLADESKKVCEAYAVWVQKSMYGRKYMGVERSTFLIDKSGKIARAWRKVKVPGHVDEVVAALKELKGKK